MLNQAINKDDAIKALRSFSLAFLNSTKTPTKTNSIKEKKETQNLLTLILGRKPSLEEIDLVTKGI